MDKINRVHAIDGIRGFSLFGILLANLLIFQYGIWGKEHVELFELGASDYWMYDFVKVAVEQSFMPIFTFLFGYSLMMMRNSLEQKALRIKWHLFRRALMLIVFGLLHATFLWEGDILFIYGMMGIFLLVFVNRKAKTLLVWSLILFAFLIFSSLPFPEEDLYDIGEMETYVDETTAIYGQGTYLEIKDHRNNGDDPIFDKIGEEYIGVVLLMMPFAIAPMFLLGMYTGAKGWLLRPKKAEKGCMTGALLCVPAGLALKIYGFYAGMEGLLTLGGTVLALGYIFLFGIMYAKFKNHILLKLFENAGKLSLTNYIMQTVICTIIFYGYGLGLFGKLGMTGAVLLGVIIFVLQMLASSFYLRYFRYGPLEKILRVWTYLSFSRKTVVRKHNTNNRQAI